MKKTSKFLNKNIFYPIESFKLLILIIISLIIFVASNSSLLIFQKFAILIALFYLLLLSFCFSNYSFLDNKFNFENENNHNKIYLNTLIETLGVAQNSVRNLKYLSDTKIDTSKDIKILEEILNELEIMEVPKKFEDTHSDLKIQFVDIINRYKK